jgi:hypothetical protein
MNEQTLKEMKLGITDEDFPLFSKSDFDYINELIGPGISYQQFLSDFIFREDYFAFFRTLQNAIVYKQFLDQIHKVKILSSAYEQHKLETMLEIVFFTILIDTFMSRNNTYIPFETYLHQLIPKGESIKISRDDLQKIISNYRREHSLLKNFKKFLNLCDFADKIWLVSSMLPPNKALRSVKSSLDEISFMIEAKSEYKLLFEIKRSEVILSFLGKEALLSNKGELSSDAIDECRKAIERIENEYTEEKIQKEMEKVAKIIYDIRSGYLHHGNKNEIMDYFIYKQDGIVLDFGEIDFIKLFIRTILVSFNIPINRNYVPGRIYTRIL